MRNIFLVSMLLVLCVGLQGQKLSKYYVSRVQPEGTIYHIFPLEVFSNDLVFDITYTSSKDSATVNFTYIAPRKSPVSEITINSQSFPVLPLYIEAEKVKRWSHRYSCKVPIPTLVDIFKSENKPQITIGERVYKPIGAWKKKITIVEIIFSSTI